MNDKRLKQKYEKYKKMWVYLEKHGWTLYTKEQYAVMDDLIHCFKLIKKEQTP
jgi:hypothetical protein